MQARRRSTCRVHDAGQGRAVRQGRVGAQKAAAACGTRDTDEPAAAGAARVAGRRVPQGEGGRQGCERGRWCLGCAKGENGGRGIASGGWEGLSDAPADPQPRTCHAHYE